MTQPPGASSLSLFASYAREDRSSISTLVEGVAFLRHRVWVDQELHGGQAWWDEILTQIRTCDALLVAVSPSLLESEASARERQYGAALGKPLLPVVIRTVHALPPDLAPIQFVDYTTPGPMTGFELAGALAALPAPLPLPEPLPPSPPVPVSYLWEVTERVYAPTLNLEDQLTLVAKLRTALERAAERDAALELLQALRRRPDLFLAAARQIDPLLAHALNASVSAGERSQTAPRHSEEDALPPSMAAVPPGWYPDPSRRHVLRWFDDDWTCWASDSGNVIDSPLK